MPPRKIPAKGKATAKAVDTKLKTSKARRSKLAKENDITAEEEGEIKEAWALFRHDDVDGYEDEDEGVLETSKVRLVLRAQGLEPKTHSELTEFLETLDPESEGYVTYPHFLALCAIQLKNKTDDSKAEDLEKAFQLFVPSQGEQIIRVQDLRAVAKVLKEDVSDDLLKAMILEANGGRGINAGVSMEEFRQIITRAGGF